MIRAVLFDLDGVIADTLHYHFLAWEKMFSEIGGSVSEESVLLHEGRASREILPLFLEEAGVDLAPEHHHDFIERKREYYRTIVEIRHFPGAFEVVGELRARGFRTALVTASATKNMEASLDTRQRSLFDVIVTGDEVRSAKPHPEPYLTAASHLGVAPEECVVIENAPLGIESAKNAGMRCIAVETTLGREYLEQADAIVHDLRELTGLREFRGSAQEPTEEAAER